MSTNTPLLPRRARAALALLPLLLAATACGGDSDSDSGSGPAAGDVEVSEALEDLGAAQEDSGVPEECAGAFPMAWGEPDLEAARLPADWPAPPADAVLCAVSDTGGSVQTIDYALTETDGVAVLDHYEQALTASAGYDVTREERPELGHEVLTGVAGGRGFEVTPRDGAFRIALAEE